MIVKKEFGYEGRWGMIAAFELWGTKDDASLFSQQSIERDSQS